MSPAQIIRTVAFALIAAGGALGLVPSGSCGAGWWTPSMGDGSYGWFAYENVSRFEFAGVAGCEAAMAPVGSWAIALIAFGATLLVVVWNHTKERPAGKPKT